jgi:hypothetical protein
MQTSEYSPPRPGDPAGPAQGHGRRFSEGSTRVVIREALAGAAILLCVSLLLGPSSPALASWAAHPGWLIVLMLAARYGNLGFLAGTIAVALAAALAPLCAGEGLESLAQRASSTGDIGAAIASVLVGWVASSRQKRTRAMVSQLAAATGRARDSEEAVMRVTEAAIALRSRADRTESSLAFLSDIADRMQNASPCGGAEAALQLALARTGARAGLVQVADNGRLRTLASWGAWSLDSLEPPTVHRDRTASAAVEQGRALRAVDVAEVRVDDSDLAAPLISRDGRVIGMMALRGVPYAAMRTASLSDLNTVARWLSRVLPNEIDAGPVARNQRRADAG